MYFNRMSCAIHLCNKVGLSFGLLSTIDRHLGKAQFTNAIKEYVPRCRIHTNSRQYVKQENFKNNQRPKPNEWNQQQNRTKSTLYYVTAIGVLAAGLSYAAVPLYRMFCQAYSYGGTTGVSEDSEKVEHMKKIANRIVRVRFNADIGASMRWNFKPQQTEIRLAPGETALAFYTACNPTDEPVTGISTYNVVPFEAGQYFNKIQCFCFEEQLLNPHEQVDMPVFFYIDPEFAEDPKMELVDTLTLSYTFFEAKEGMQLPVPAYAR